MAACALAVISSAVKRSREIFAAAILLSTIDLSIVFALLTPVEMTMALIDVTVGAV